VLEKNTLINDCNFIKMLVAGVEHTVDDILLNFYENWVFVSKMYTLGEWAS